MSDSASQPEPQLQPDPPAPMDESKTETAAETAAPEMVTLPAAEIEATKRELADWKDRCLRNQAEFENIRKRLRKEADEAGSRGVARAVKPLLNEIDNLARAIESAKPETFADFAQGVTMIRENLRGALAAQGIEPVLCEGIFDPSLHEVIAEQESSDVPKGTILSVFRSGYRLKEQLVRTAQVVVAKPVTEKPAEPAG